MKSFISRVVLLATLSLVLFVAACDRQGPVEKAGEKVDETVEKTKDNLSK